jgi:hypothetical protein
MATIAQDAAAYEEIQMNDRSDEEGLKVKPNIVKTKSGAAVIFVRVLTERPHTRPKFAPLSAAWYSDAVGG